MDNKYEILRILRESDASVSGQELSERIGISRTAVWKHIRSLEEEGYGIEAVNRKGYRLVGVPDSIAATTACSSTRRSRAKLRRTVVGFIFAMASALIMPLVASISGTWIVI